METTEVRYCGVLLYVEYEVNGRYFPATRGNPEEFPDYIIKIVSASDSMVNLIDILTEEQLDDISELIERL